jgi:hypothetical protein
MRMRKVAGVFMLVGAAVCGPPRHLANARGMAATPRPTPTCRPAQLTLSSVGAETEAGNVRELFRWRNRSTQACVLLGYPQVHLLDARHRPQPTYVVHEGGRLTPPTADPRAVRLDHGGSAFVSLEWGDSPAPGLLCPVSHYMRLTPPGASSPQRVGEWAEWRTVCGGVLVVSPVEPRAF